MTRQSDSEKDPSRERVAVSTEDALLRRLLLSAEDDSPSRDQSRRIVEALDRRFGVESTNQGDSGTIADQGRLLRLRFPKSRAAAATALVLICVSAAAVQLVRRMPGPIDGETPKSVVSSSPPSTLRAADLAPPSASPSLEPEIAPDIARASEVGRLPKRPVPPSSSSSSDLTPTSKWNSEVELLDAAQRALARRDGGTALSLSTEHRQAFPRGTYREEFERIAIEALLQLGKRAQALAAKRRFFERYPRSVHKPRLESLLPDG